MRISIDVKYTGGRALAARLRDMPAKVFARVRVTMEQWSEALETYIKDEKLSGQVLNRVTGSLAESMVAMVFETGNTVKAVLSNATPYAMIHEYGGQTSAHIILPSKASVLSFVAGGQLTFAYRVNHPGSAIPENSYMRSALADKRNDILADLKTAVAEGLRE